MENIMMTTTEYLLYLRARKKQMEDYILECLKNAEGQSMSETEIFTLVEEKFHCELPVDDKDQIILKGILRNLLDWFEVQEVPIPIIIRSESGYQFSGKNNETAA